MEMIKNEQIHMELQKSFMSGESAKASTACYSYQSTSSGDLVIDPAGAKIVTFIFNRFVQGDSLGKISDALARMGVDSSADKETWSREAISKLLSNE